MGVPFPNDTEDSPYFQILQKNPAKDSNLNSFWAFLLSIFVYVSVFYVFNLSPSTDLLCTTKFWFIISNTLILIIAADFSSSSSSSKHHNTINQVISTPSLIHHKKMPKYPTQEEQEEEEVDHQEPAEKIINIVGNKPPEISTFQDDKDDRVSEINKSKGKTCARLSHTGHKLAQNNTHSFQSVEASSSNYTPPNGETSSHKTSSKSKLQKIEKMVEGGDEKQGKMVLRRTLSERQSEEPMVLEENEFTKMSNEELNKRVEEFIRRCNRQIRLEAVSNRRRQG